VKLYARIAFMATINVPSLLEKLQIRATNPGACFGPERWLASAGGSAISSLNPTTGTPIASVQPAQDEAYERVVTESTQAFARWRDRPAPKRGELIRDLGAALRDDKEPLGDLVSLEMGKIRAEGHGEVQEMIDICDFAVGLSRQLYGLTLASERPGHRMMEQWHPLGPVGVITAFNFPVAVWSWNAAIAAVCGDTVVWKPADAVPLCAVAVQHIANRVMADHDASGVLSLLVGPGSSIGERLLHDRRLPLISFTGSTAVGRHVAETVAARFGRTILELGGNNAIIVDADARLELAVRAILFGAVGTAGQRCTSTRRLIVHRSIAPALIERLVRAYQQVAIGDPLADGTLMGPLVNAAAVEQMDAALERARAEGGEVLWGGRRRSELGPFFVEPAIVRMPAQTAIVRQETFAPILYLMEYDDFSTALRLHNDVPQGLSSAIFTENMRRAEEFVSARGSDCGIANVNIGTSGAEIGGAFGGEKETGGGRESGSDAWKAYMRRQTNTVNWSEALPLAQGITFGSDAI
jgi:L-aminoadipate-semialdehyde dehydrogenase